MSLTPPLGMVICPITPGTLLAGRYTAEMLIGEGTFGWVFSAIDTAADRPSRAAIKVLRPEHAAVGAARQRFEERELAILRRVDAAGPAPNVVRPIQALPGLYQGLPFLVLEFIDGPSLKDRIDSNQPIGSAEATRIGAGIARGLASLHAAGGVHRDLKPSNVRLRQNGEPVIVDLGIVKALWETMGFTVTGQKPMTPRYAAPEQLAGGDVGPACDVYALGIILEELRVTGHAARVAQSCLEREPQRRPKAADVAVELSVVEAGGTRAPLPRSVMSTPSASVSVLHQPVHATVGPACTSTTPMRTMRYQHTATLLASGEVLVVGGYSVSKADSVAEAECYDPKTGRWSAAGCSARRMFHTATLLPSGEVLIAGGAQRMSLASVERYDPKTCTFRLAASMRSERAHFSATWIPRARRVLVTGGADKRGFSQMSAELYDPDADRWTDASPMRVARSFHTAVWLPALEQVLVAGGADERGFSQASAELYDPVADTWIQAAPLQVARGRATATLLDDGRLLVTDGSRDGASIASAELYDPRTNTWTAASPLSMLLSSHVAALLDDGRVLVAGYNGITTVATLYDPSVDTWTPTASTRWRHSHATMTRLEDGRVLVIGSELDEDTVPEVFDPNPTPSPSRVHRSMVAHSHDPRWTQVAPMQVPRMLHTMTLLPSNRVLVVGVPLGTAFNFAEVYDPTSETWGPLLMMSVTPPGRGSPTATLIPNTGKVLITGGMHTSGTHAHAELYNDAEGSFSPAAPMLDYRNGHTATLLSYGEVLVIGGYGGGYHETVESYDPETNIWTLRAPMSIPRVRHCATLLSDGSVLVSGGGVRSSVFNTAERYDPSHNTWMVTAPMRERRLHHTATLLPDGTVLLAGGLTIGEALAGAEIYDPALDAFRPIAPMATPRLAHTATLLPNGTVLVAGGSRGNDANLASVEIYNPKSDAWTEGSPLGTARTGHAALLLPNGYILITGGRNDSGVLSSAERYEVE